MAIAVRASGSVTYDVHNVTSQTVTKPASVQAGDVAIAVMSWGLSAQANGGTPTGWTTIALNVGVAGGANGERTSAFYRVIQAGDSTWSFAAPGAADVGIVFQAFTGVDNTTPIDATGTTSTNTGSATITANAVTVATSGAWHLIVTGCWLGGAASATSFTDLNNGAPASNEQADFLYNQTPKSTGSTGTVTVTQGGTTGNQLSAIPFALRPAVAAAATLVIPPFPSLPTAFLAM